MAEMIKAVAHYYSNIDLDRGQNGHFDPVPGLENDHRRRDADHLPVWRRVVSD